MKSVIKFTIVVCAMAVAVSSALAAKGGNQADNAAGGKKHKQAAAQADQAGRGHQAGAKKDVNVTGTLTATERKGKDGQDVKVYSLTAADGTKVTISPKAAKETDVTPYSGKNVTLVGKGIEKETPKGKTVMVVEITSIREVAAAE